jgi:hypothetical protein
MVMVVGYLKDLGGKAPSAMAEPWRGKAVAEPPHSNGSSPQFLIDFPCMILIFSALQIF